MMGIGRSMTPSYSISGLSTTSRASGRSVETLTTIVEEKTGLKIPILSKALVTNVQRGSVLSSSYTVIEGLFSLVTGLFDIYCLSLTYPGAKHYGYYLFSFDFVYVGNPHVRNSLMLFGAVTALWGIALMVTSIMLLQGLRKEIEVRLEPWLWCVGLFTIWRSLVIIYASIVNDMYFAYHIVMCLMWILLIVANAYAWLVVHSFYHELCEITRLEDVARVKMETMSFMGSRPTTPGARSIVSTTLS
ncbi:hypothetical protein Anas_00378 [Armadillidium nasatum]|uniref:Transmembrane protein n=1 Tax=Armadillidium nasatum TaxID=96803 RepID=A0A5N5SLE9_9CRUS|nr:hypothetical protein Anas_00378 [Armadillidium nasatum]